MPEETLDLHDEPINKTEERIRGLSSKVKETSQERDAFKAEADTAKATAAALVKERDFFASFSDVAAKYPTSSEFKDQIKEKVMAGYTVEDATVSVLNAQGKLVPPPAAPPAPAGGGSAPNILPESGTKSVQEMTQAERRQALMDAEKRGDLGLT